MCVDDIVTNITVTLLKDGMLENLTSTVALASSTISLTNVFELKEDQNYIVNVSFSYFEETNVLESMKAFGKYRNFTRIVL